MACSDLPGALTIGASSFDQLSIGSDSIDTLSIGSGTFVYLTIGSFNQLTPDHLPDQSGVLDAYQLDEQSVLDD